MTVIATASNPRFTVSRVDIDRDGPTYTIDTLRDLKAQRPDAELFFITGADAIAQILSWRDHDELWDLAHFVAVSRPGHVLSTDGLPTDDVSQLEIPALAISSTDCRERVERGTPRVVPRSRRGRPIHCEAPPLPEQGMSTPEQPATPALTRKQLREIRNTGATPIIVHRRAAPSKTRRSRRAPAAPEPVEAAEASSTRSSRRRPARRTAAARGGARRRP